MKTRNLSYLRKHLLEFYKKYQRNLPWRHISDPYAIWVSEIMLQQTQVDTVIPRYQQFMQEFPDIAHLAAAGAHRVCEAWAGLGYYRRARLLHAGAEYVLQEHGGVLPRDLKKLERIPGIGRYTSGAIASIAFGMQAPLVDGNVERVLGRFFALKDEVKSKAGQEALWAWAEELVQGPEPGDMNQALMEFGALLCRPRAPLCAECPLTKKCAAWATGDVDAYPKLKARAARKTLNLALALVRDTHGAFLLEQRPLDGLWAGLWEPPAALGAKAKKDIEQRLGIALGRVKYRFKHILTHREVIVSVYIPAQPIRTNIFQVPKITEDPLDEPLSGPARKALERFLA